MRCLKTAEITILFLLASFVLYDKTSHVWGNAPEKENSVKPGKTSTTTPIPPKGMESSAESCFAKRAKLGGIDLVFLGDSITAGWWKHKELWEKYYGKMNAANFGRGGDRVQNVLWRVQNGDADGYSAKVVVLMIGTNNMNDNTEDEIAAGIKNLIGVIKKKQPKARILLLGVPPGNSPASKGMKKRDAVNDRISKFEDGTTINYFNLRNIFLDSEGNPVSGVFTDSLHLDSKGYELWAESMHSVLVKMMK